MKNKFKLEKPEDWMFLIGIVLTIVGFIFLIIKPWQMFIIGLILVTAGYLIRQDKTKNKKPERRKK